MTRPTARKGVPRPYHPGRSLAEQHASHGPVPFFGCPLCVRRTPFKGLDQRWSSPRLG